MKLSCILAVISTLLWFPQVWAQEKSLSKDSLFIQTEKFEAHEGNCDDPETGCINLSLSYPILKGGNPKIAKNINQTIYSELISLFSLHLEPFAPDKPGLRLAAEQFMDEWKAVIDETGEPVSWMVLAEAQVAYQTERVLVVNMNSRIVTDEFVSEDRISAFNFDLKTGAQIQLYSLVKDSLSLKTLVLEKLQSTYPEASRLYNLNDLSAFTLPANFELRSTGIFLWFNEMEAPVGPQGPVSVYLTYEELDGIIRREKFF